MPSKDRRQFIKQGLLGLTGAGLAAHSLRTVKTRNSGSADKEIKSGKIIYRTFGKTGIKIPVISMGTGDTITQILSKQVWTKGSSYMQHPGITVTDGMKK